MTVQIRPQAIAQQDILGDSQIKANSSLGQNTADLSPATPVLEKNTQRLALEQSIDTGSTYDDAEQEFVFVLPDILLEDQNLETSGDTLLDNEQADATNEKTPNELQAFIQSPRVQSFKIQQTALPENVTEQALKQNNITVSLADITSPLEVPVVIHDIVKVTTTPEVTVTIEADKLISSNPSHELLVKSVGVNNIVQDQYLDKRFLSEDSPSNSSVSNINRKSITTDAINTLATSTVLTDEKDFQKGLTQQVLSGIENRENTFLKSPLGSTFDTQPVNQQWRKEQLTNNTSEWGQRLLHVLSDKVNLQIGQQVQRAQIRLDPPQLGSIDISISVEGDKTTVHLVAGNAQIREAMQQTLDQLRQSLSQTGDVTVEVDVGEKQQQSGNSSDTPEMDIAENIAVEEDVTLKTTENSARDWLNRLV